MLIDDDDDDDNVAPLAPTSGPHRPDPFPPPTAVAGSSNPTPRSEPSASSVIQAMALSPPLTCFIAPVPFDPPPSETSELFPEAQLTPDAAPGVLTRGGKDRGA